MFRWLVNVGFLALPIAATLGVLLAIQAHRQATGKPPMFGPPLDNGWFEKTYCQKFVGISPDSNGQRYTLNPNQWAWNEGEPGFLCMNITTFANQTYATKTSAPQFRVFWQYPQASPQQPVHAYPNVKVDSDVLPATLQSVKEIVVDMAWTMRLDNKTDEPTNLDELKASNVNSNVAIDMFLDSDKSKANDSERAAYEIMVWFAAIGPGTFAIGQERGPIKTKTLNGTDFNLFFGQNSRKQNVITWKAVHTAVNDFHGDINHLMDEILQTNAQGFPSPSDYLGYFSFGSEAYNSDKPVTFSVPTLSIDIRKS